MIHSLFMRSTWLGIVFGVFLAAESVSGADTAWNVSTGDWSIAGNWTSGEPTSADNAYINNNGTATVSQVDEICTYLYCQTGAVRIVSGTLFSTNQTFGNTAGNYGTCVQEGGSNTVDGGPGTGSYLYLGCRAGSTGIYILSAGYLDVMKTSGWGGEYIGGDGKANGGYGRFIQTGGTNNARINLGYNGRGVYDLVGGLCIGGRGTRTCTIFSNGVFNQSGGRFEDASYTGIAIGGTYNFTGGEIYLPAAWQSATVATNAFFNMGDTNGSGRIWGSVGWLGINEGGTLRGWGTNSCGGRFTMSGRVIADGWPGTTADRTLDLSSFTDLRFAATNAASNGWYAFNRGKLILRKITAPTGTSTQFWGCATNLPSIPNQLVNSVTLIFSNVTVGGTMTNALLALDRSDLPPASPGVRYFIGAWQMTRPAALAFGSLTLSFRYDDNARAAKLITPENLTLWHSTGGAWSIIPGVVDSSNKLLNATVTTLATNEYFALGSPWFASGSVIKVH